MYQKEDPQDEEVEPHEVFSDVNLLGAILILMLMRILQQSFYQCTC